MDLESAAVLIAERDGTVISQNRAAQQLLGRGTGKHCWSVFGGLDNVQGLPCRRGCVLELLTRGMDHSLNCLCKINGQRYHLNCIPVNDTAICALSRSTGTAPAIFQLLTPREREILKLLAAGKTTRSIGDFLEISRFTVQTHVEKMRDKFAASTQAAVVARGFHFGYLD